MRNTQSLFFIRDAIHRIYKLSVEEKQSNGNNEHKQPTAVSGALLKTSLYLRVATNP